MRRVVICWWQPMSSIHLSNWCINQRVNARL